MTMAKKGVLLINVGTPDEPTIPSVKKYLREFLLDPDVIDIPAPVSYTHLTLPTTPYV